MNEDEEIMCEKCGLPCHPNVPCSEIIAFHNHVDSEYFRLLRLVLEKGIWKKNRTGMDTKGIFGAQAKFAVDMDAFPVLTTKKVFFKGILHELLWFINGDTNIKYLVDNDVHIWDEWAYKRYDEINHAFRQKEQDKVNKSCCDWMEIPYVDLSLLSFDAFINRIKTDANFAAQWGELGEGTYGSMWRAFPYVYKETVAFNTFPDTIFVREQYVDQLKNVMDTLKTDPDSRRMIVSAWHPYLVDHCALPPCHVMFHFNTEELTREERRRLVNQSDLDSSEESPISLDRAKLSDDSLDQLNIPRHRLNVLLYQRSCDAFLGMPFNITSYCLLLAMVAHCSNMVPGTFTHTYGDLHIYKNHMEQVDLQLGRTPKLLPSLWINPKIKDLFALRFEDIKLKDYQSHPAIKGDVSV